MPLHKRIIAGPCAIESREQLLSVAAQLADMGITEIRGPIRKPRTEFISAQETFLGLGEEAIPYLAEVSQMGLTVATEVMDKEDVSEIVYGILSVNKDAPVILWLGARNQNDKFQRELGRMLLDMPSNVSVMVKNPLHGDKEGERHWLGIVSHITSSGLANERILLCHRGFAISGRENPNDYRNLPDFAMAMRVKQETGLQMLLDPSHIAGKRAKVIELVKKAMGFNFDGLLIEVHPDADRAKTDASQQLYPHEFRELLRLLKSEAE